MNYVSLFQLRQLTSNMRKAGKDIEQFNAKYANLNFDIIYDISNAPFELLIGALNANWACILKIEQGFRTKMSDDDFYALCNLLNLKPSKESLTSFKFLVNIASQAPEKCNTAIVDPSHLIPFRKNKIQKTDDPNKIYFSGWNNHLKDKRKAHNFEKTELFFGKKVADFCRTHNISSMWTDKIKDSKKPNHPWST